jgi:hypothetical protein
MDVLLINDGPEEHHALYLTSDGWLAALDEVGGYEHELVNLETLAEEARGELRIRARTKPLEVCLVSAGKALPLAVLEPGVFGLSLRRDSAGHLGLHLPAQTPVAHREKDWETRLGHGALIVATAGYIRLMFEPLRDIPTGPRSRLSPLAV